MDPDQVFWTKAMLLGNDSCQVPGPCPKHPNHPKLDAPDPYLTPHSSPVVELGAFSKPWKVRRLPPSKTLKRAV